MSALHKHISGRFSDLKDRHILVACSGGIDSTVLLHLASQIFKNVTALHVNYYLRGEESDADEAFVQKMAIDLGVECMVLSHDLAKESQSSSIQAKAREIRYNWFHDVQRASNGILFLGHNADDQIETFYLSLSRNSGVMGLACMLERKNNLCRPLLSFKRSEIHEYAVQNAINWREDSSNSELKYTRNKLRNEFLPFLRKQLPNIDQSVLLINHQMQQLQLQLESEIEPIQRECITAKVIRYTLLSDLNELQQFELFRQLDLPAKLIQELPRVQQKGAWIPLTANAFGFQRIAKGTEGFELIMKVNEELPKLIISTVSELPELFSKNEIYLDAEKLKGQPRIRKPELGDRMQLIGTQGSKLLSDIIAGSKLTFVQKEQVVVVCDDQAILWCPGLCVGRTAIADKTSTKIIKIVLTTNPLAEAPQ